MNRAKSLLQIPSPDSTVFVIRHEEPRIRIERTHVSGDARDTFSIDLTTDGMTVEATHRGIDIRSRAYWEGATLVFDSVMTQGGETGTNIVRYEIADAGRTFIAVEKVDFAGHAHTNRWVFDRQ